MRLNEIMDYDDFGETFWYHVPTNRFEEMDGTTHHNEAVYDNPELFDIDSSEPALRKHDKRDFDLDELASDPAIHDLMFRHGWVRGIITTAIGHELGVSLHCNDAQNLWKAARAINKRVPMVALHYDLCHGEGGYLMDENLRTFLRSGHINS